MRSSNVVKIWFCSLVPCCESQDVIVTVGWKDSLDPVSGETLHKT
jgi:hypothetical protein